jgi:hypothetical protein
MSTINLKLVEVLNYWIEERLKILNKRDAGERKPWTTDPIFRSYKFCNVHREDDRVTKWFARNWRAPRYWSEPNFVPAMILGRTINWPDTLEAIGFPFEWDADGVLHIMDNIQNHGGKVYTGAYMITAGPTGVRKNVWVIGNAESYFEKPPKLDPDSIQKSWEILMEMNYPCVGPFIAGQVIADLKQTPILRKANDWHDWAALGPGSTKGLNRLYGRKVTEHINQKQGLREMKEVRTHVKQTMCLQDLQNCLCEFDKYVRVMNGEGKPRSSYAGT